MESVPLEQVVRNVDARLTRVEQILPTLAMKADLAEAIAPLATKAELAEAIAPLATKAELAEAIAPLATKVALHEGIARAIAPLATKSEVREEGERTRRHFDAVAEPLEGRVQLLAEGQVALQERMEAGFREVRLDIAQLDRRVMRLEAGRRPRRRS